jgi:hypothetical protein
VSAPATAWQVESNSVVSNVFSRPAFVCHAAASLTSSSATKGKMKQPLQPFSRFALYYRTLSATVRPHSLTLLVAVFAAPPGSIRAQQMACRQIQVLEGVQGSQRPARGRGRARACWPARISRLAGRARCRAPRAQRAAGPPRFAWGKRFSRSCRRARCEWSAGTHRARGPRHVAADARGCARGAARSGYCTARQLRPASARGTGIRTGYGCPRSDAVPRPRTPAHCRPQD